MNVVASSVQRMITATLFNSNGDLSTLEKNDFLERKYQVGKNVELLTIMDDPAYTGGENKDVQIALRMLGCGRRKVFKLTHMYWA
jgi:hypothetical protein